MFISSIYILLLFLTTTFSYPCPRECICKPTDTDDIDFVRMSYIIACTNVPLKNDQLVFSAPRWSVNEEKPYDPDDDDDTIKKYEISIDISSPSSLKKFTDKTIRFTNFSYVVRSLSLTNQGNKFTLDLKSFVSPIYENLKVLNLSSCCKQIPKQCQELFHPLTQLRVLDLSGSDMYKTCLNTPDTISSKLHDLILRNNIYDKDIFSTSSKIFDGVRGITGTLDLQNSRLKLDTNSNRTCLFNLFQRITTLDLSSVQFEAKSNDFESHLTQLLGCNVELNSENNGHQLLNLYLRHLNIETIPQWLTSSRFPLLNRLDLSKNNIQSIDINTFTKLYHVVLAYNPIELFNITWSENINYRSINLRSTIRNQTYNLSKRLKNLFKLTKTIDFSDNEGDLPAYVNITDSTIHQDSNTFEFSLYVSRTNLHSFEIDADNIRRLDVSFNHLTELNLKKQIKVNYLDCSNQNLSQLILSRQLSELEEIKCSNNSLRTIINFSLIDHAHLKLFDLSINNIDSLEELFQNLTSRTLRTINLKSNFIKIIPSFIFHNKLTGLYEINLSYNRIHTIRRHAFQSPNLRILDLTGNLLKNIEPQAINTQPLRLFYVIEDIKKVTNNTTKSESLKKFLSLYRRWFEKYGDFMKNNPRENEKSIDLAQLLSNGNETKVTRKYYGLYVTFGVILVCVLFGGIYIYQKHSIGFFSRMKRYRKLNKNNDEKNATELTDYQREDDEIVMNLDEPPFNSKQRVANN